MLNIINTQEIQAMCAEYKEYKRMIEETQSLADAIADRLKAAMTEAGEEKIIVGQYKLTYVDAIRRDIDRKRLESEHKAIFDEMLKETSYKRFSVA